MITNVALLCIILGLLCFLAAAFKKPDPMIVSYFPLGAAFVTLAFLLSRLPWPA